MAAAGTIAASDSYPAGYPRGWNRFFPDTGRNSFGVRDFQTPMLMTDVDADEDGGSGSHGGHGGVGGSAGHAPDAPR